LKFIHGLRGPLRTRSEAMLELKGIRVISFDVTGTLVSERFVDYFWLDLIPRLFAERHAVDPEEAKRIVFSKYDEVGRDDIRWYIPSYWFELLDLKAGLREALEAIRGEIEVYDDAREALKRLSTKYDLVVSSNLSREFIDVALDVLGFRGFKAVFSCVSDLGLTTKTPSFYSFVASKLRVPPKAILHVGDDTKRDYENPIKAGLRALLVVRRGVPCLPHVRNLKELLELLD
jgi:putative hydrolase of the HAD superfamily